MNLKTLLEKNKLIIDWSDESRVKLAFDLINYLDRNATLLLTSDNPVERILGKYYLGLKYEAKDSDSDAKK